MNSQPFDEVSLEANVDVVAVVAVVVGMLSEHSTNKPPKSYRTKLDKSESQIISRKAA